MRMRSNRDSNSQNDIGWRKTANAAAMGRKGMILLNNI